MHTETGKLCVNQVRNWHLFLFPTVSSPYKKDSHMDKKGFFGCVSQMNVTMENPGAEKVMDLCLKCT